MTHSPPFGRAPVAAWPWLLAGLLALPLLALFLRGFPALPGTAKDLDVVLTSLLLATAGSLITLALALGLAVLGVLGGVGRTLEALPPPGLPGAPLCHRHRGPLQPPGLRGADLRGARHPPGLGPPLRPLAYLLLKPQVRVAMGLLAAARVHGVGGAKALRVFLPPSCRPSWWQGAPCTWPSWATSACPRSWASPSGSTSSPPWPTPGS